MTRPAHSGTWQVLGDRDSQQNSNPASAPIAGARGKLKRGQEMGVDGSQPKTNAVSRRKRNRVWNARPSRATREAILAAVRRITAEDGYGATVSRLRADLAGLVRYSTLRSY